MAIEIGQVLNAFVVTIWIQMKNSGQKSQFDYNSRQNFAPGQFNCLSLTLSMTVFMGSSKVFHLHKMTKKECWGDGCRNDLSWG